MYIIGFWLTYTIAIVLKMQSIKLCVCQFMYLHGIKNIFDKIIYEMETI